jgi:hypothetical protein
VVIVCGKGDETYASTDQERSQGVWNAAVRELFSEAAKVKP